MALNTYSLLLLVILISTTSACHSGSLRKQVSGEKAYVCLHFGNNNTNAFAYTVIVDKMVRLTVKNDTILNQIDPLYFKVTSDTIGMRNNSKPLYKLYKQEGKYFPVHTAIIHLKDGVLTGITYDDTDSAYCKSICSNSCEDISYYYYEDEEEYKVVDKTAYRGYGCYVKEPSKLQVYVVWTGTDKDGVQLTSAGSRFSRFAQYGGKKMYEKIIEAADN